MHDRYVDTWKAFIRLREEGKVRSIGVSNFLPEHLDRLEAETGTLPAINQIELHPEFQQRAVRDYHAEHGIQLEAYSPARQRRLTRQSRHRRDCVGARTHTGAGDPALAHAAGDRGDPEIGHAGPHPVQFQRGSISTSDPSRSPPSTRSIAARKVARARIPPPFSWRG